MIKCSKRAITRQRTQGGHEIETSEQNDMGLSRNWLRSLRKKLLHQPPSHTHREIVVIDTGSDPSLLRELIELGGGDADGVKPMRGHGQGRVLELPARSYTKEDEAAVKIQAAFRGHLARRAFRALRSLVRLQALARGAYVRKQAQIALECMHILARLQVRVRARQLLGNFDG